MGVPYFFGVAQQPGVDPWWETVPDEVKTELQDFIEDGGAEMGEPCFWYDAKNQSCKHHSCRPTICRDFEVGGQRCVNLRAAKGMS